MRRNIVEMTVTETQGLEIEHDHEHVPEAGRPLLQSDSIVQQMGRFFNLFAIAILLLTASAIYGASRVDQRVGELADRSFMHMVSSEAKLSLRNTKAGLEQLAVARGSEEQLGLVLSNFREAKAGIERMEVAAQTDLRDNASQVKELAALARQIDGNLVTLLPRLETGGAGEGAIPAALLEVDRLDVQLASLHSSTNSELATLSRLGIDEVRRVMALLMIIGVIAISLVVIGKRIVTRQMANPLALISDASQRIATGETEIVIPCQSREDEIGTLARSLNVLRDVQISAISHAETELEREKELQEERARQQAEQAEMREALALQFEKTIGDVANQVAAASEQMKQAANSLAETVDTSSTNMENANALLAEATRGMTGAAAATDEFALSISEVSAQALVSSKRAKKAAEAAASADETIGAMTESAGKISQIVEVIASIAQRTNLLALNASIEAARSAEAGRGFAVVANEVKALALQTHRETAEVEALITTMQNATGHSASALSTIAQEVIELEAAAGTIAGAVDQQAGAGQDLAKAIDMAARNTSEASESFVNVKEVTDASTETASKLRDSSEMLSAQADLLREQVAQFLGQVRVQESPDAEGSADRGLTPLNIGRLIAT